MHSVKVSSKSPFYQFPLRVIVLFLLMGIAALVTSFSSRGIFTFLKIPRGLAPKVLQLPAHSSYKEKTKCLEGDSADDIVRSEIRLKLKAPRKGLPLKLSKPKAKYFSQIGQDKRVDGLLKNRTHGIFVEVGGYDGESLSNTLFLERERGWSGLLIEASPANFRRLLSKNRNVSSLNACLSPGNFVSELKFASAGSGGLLSDAGRDRMTCYPLGMILESMRLRHVDFLSLDIEGDEFPVLASFPFFKIRIDVMIIEYGTYGNPKNVIAERLRNIKSLIKRLGTYKIIEVNKQDIIVMHNSLV